MVCLNSHYRLCGLVVVTKTNKSCIELMSVKIPFPRYKQNTTERGGSVVTHEIRIWEVLGLNPGAGQPDRFFRGFPQSS